MQREHEAVVIEDFNGWWTRGDPESCPSDHFIQADNIQYIHSGFRTRDPINRYQIGQSLGKIVRVYNFVQQGAQSLIVLREGGDIFHLKSPTETTEIILSIPEMEDFGFVSFAGRGYITPFKTFKDEKTGVNVEKGLEHYFMYVYKGDGSPARKAGGNSPTNSSQSGMIVFNSETDGKVTKGVHLLACAFDSGILGPEVFPVVKAPGGKQIQIAKIPIGLPGVVKRTIVMTKAVDPKDYKSDQTTYTYYVAKEIEDNTTSDIKIDLADADLTAVYTPGIALPPSGGMHVIQSTDAGHCDFGFHLVAVVYETDTGYLTALGPEQYAGNEYVDIRKAVHIKNIPVPTDAYVVKKHLVSTKWIPEYNGDQKGYEFWFIPDGSLENDVTEKIVSYYDADLLDDASHLIDNLTEIKAGVCLTTYHGRLVLGGQFADPSIVRVSAAGEPEAISGVDGLIIAPLDGNPITNAQEFRDVLYLFKKNRTYSASDNDEEPASWLVEVVDQGVGCGVHGVGTILDSGGVSIDYLLVASYSGLILFNGVYSFPELSWKIENYWRSIIRNDYRFIQLAVDSIDKKIWMTLPEPSRHHMLFADYANGIDAKNIRWAKWIFDAKMSTVALYETNKLILGAIEKAP